MTTKEATEDFLFPSQYARCLRWLKWKTDVQWQRIDMQSFPQSINYKKELRRNWRMIMKMAMLMVVMKTRNMVNKVLLRDLHTLTPLIVEVT